MSTQITEQWKPINGFETYEVSNYGQVRNSKRNKIMKPATLANGYLQLGLSKNGVPSLFKIHRLVAAAFITNPSEKPHIDHIDGIKTNNNVNNLRWATVSENACNKGINATNTSGVKGVCWDKKIGKWKAAIRIEGRIKHLGYFECIEEARKVRVAKAIEIYGDFVNEFIE